MQAKELFLKTINSRRRTHEDNLCLGNSHCHTCGLLVLHDLFGFLLAYIESKPHAKKKDLAARKHYQVQTPLMATYK